MKYQHVIVNINKLLDFWRLSINDLSKETGISLNGLKNMMETGLFKLEPLERIGKVLKVPMIVLIADEISVTHQISSNSYPSAVIYWYGGFVEAQKTTLFGREGILNVEYQSEKQIIKDQPKDLADKYKYYKRLYDEDQLEILNVRTELYDKKELIGFIRRENLILYANIIHTLVTLKLESLEVEKYFSILDSVTKSKVFNDEFLYNLLDSKLITNIEVQEIKVLRANLNETSPE